MSLLAEIRSDVRSNGGELRTVLFHRGFHALLVHRVGRGCALGAGANVRGGVDIGEGTVIGANAVALQDVPTQYVVAPPPIVKVGRSRRTPQGESAP